VAPHDRTSDTPLLDKWLSEIGDDAVVEAVAQARRSIAEGTMPGFSDKGEFLEYLRHPHRQTAWAGGSSPPTRPRPILTGWATKLALHLPMIYFGGSRRDHPAPTFGGSGDWISLRISSSRDIPLPILSKSRLRTPRFSVFERP